MAKTLHIIAFDVPYPPNYGGIVDVFFKLKTLHELGTKIIYHCFYYSGHNPPNEILENYCHEINYYPRRKEIGKLTFSRYPYVVASRHSGQLLERLLKDDYPILFDGIQTCYYLEHKALRSRLKLFRANNIEHAYYKGLAQWETRWLQKFYLRLEAKKLARFEPTLGHAQGILSVAKMDIPHFSQYAPTHHVPPFFNQHGLSPQFQKAKKPFCLFQGNLSVTENIEAAQFIIKQIAPLVDVDIVIAGKSAPSKLVRLAKQTSNIKLISDPLQSEMDDLISSAQVNLLLTFQQTGIKLKLLHALASGQHILINSLMDDANIFKAMCHVEDDPFEIARCINELMNKPFSELDYQKRLTRFRQYFDNQKNAQFILNVLNNLEKESMT